MKVSAVIPAYNASETILSCLETVLPQVEETIVVDDGSVDGTADLVRRAFPAVTVVAQSNQGVSAARNAGMAAATGDYLVFVDADDALYPGAVPAACEALAPTTDILILRSFTGGAEQYPWKSRFREGSDYGRDDIVDSGYMRGSVWGCLYRREYLEQIRLRFPVGISMAEDQLFLNAAFAGGARVRFRDIKFYEFNERPGSASRSYDDRYFHRLSAALAAAPGMISDPALCAHVRLSILLGMTTVAIRTGRNPAWVMQTAKLGEVLPLPVFDMKKGRAAARLANFSYPILYRVLQIRELLS